MQQAAEPVGNGLSPRGRGKLGYVAVLCSVVGSIPAWAGETAYGAVPVPSSKVYPRVGGGNNDLGNVRDIGGGLSPRGRGKPPFPPLLHRPQGSIPAWAGETGYPPCRRGWGRVYPRVGGGNRVSPGCDNCYMGLSPRGRGKQRPAQPRNRQRRSIPAWAGETRGTAGAGLARGVYPRVGGGNRGYGDQPVVGRGLSPRGRGKPS